MLGCSTLSLVRGSAAAEAEVTQFIHLFHKYNAESCSPAPHLQTFAAWQEHLSSSPCAGSNFEHHDLAPHFQLQHPLFVSIRKDVFQGLLNMISNGAQEPVPSEIRDPETNERMYSEQYTGDNWLRLQVSLHLFVNKGWPSGIYTFVYIYVMRFKAGLHDFSVGFNRNNCFTDHMHFDPDNMAP